MTITDFLLARIEEDETRARKLALTDTRPALSLATTINHPERLLAEAQAKRAIVAAWTIAEDGAGNYPTLDAGYAEGLAAAVHHLAAIYSDHPDYNTAWRVD